MASPNVVLVRSIYAAWERGDFGSTEWADPEIEFVLSGGIADGAWTGLAGMAEGWRTYLSAWEDLRSEVDEYRELDEERVLVLTRLTGRGRTSGLELGQMRAKGATLLHINGGKVTKLVVYADADHALADLGLAPDTGAP
jgi:ketosteroid isomerase-like protein